MPVGRSKKFFILLSDVSEPDALVAGVAADVRLVAPTR